MFIAVNPRQTYINHLWSETSEMVLKWPSHIKKPHLSFEMTIKITWPFGNAHGCFKTTKGLK